LDSVGCFFVAFNFGYVRRFPITGEFSEIFLRQSESLLRRHAWLRRCSLLALVIYAMMPFKGSGGIGGTLLGFVLGVGGLKTWVAVLTGSAIASFSLAYSAAAARDVLMRMRRGGYVVLAFFICVVAYNFYRQKRISRARVPVLQDSREVARL